MQDHDPRRAEQPLACGTGRGRARALPLLGPRVERRRSRTGGSTADGPNRLPAGKPRSLLARVFAQFNNLLIYVLLASALVAVAAWSHSRRGGHPRRRRHQRDHRLHPGGPGGEVARGHSRDADARVLGPARRAATDRSRRKPGGRRRRADRSRRPHSRRPQALARHQPQDRRGGADRRSGARPTSRPIPSRRTPRSATAPRWPIPARWSRAARARASWSRPAPRPSLAASAPWSGASKR